MATKITFTKEHLEKLKELYTDLSFKGETISSVAGANNLSPWDMLHGCSLKNLKSIMIGLKRTISSKQELDEWSMTEYQQSQLSKLEKQAEFVNLLIGYKRSESEKAASNEELKRLKSQLEEIRQSAMTPTEQMAEIQKRIDELQN